MPSAGHSPEWDWPAYAVAFGRRLQRLRKGSGLSQLALAQRAELTPNSVKLLELGRSSGDKPANPELRTVYRLAEALGVTPADLLPSVADVPTALPREAHADFSWSDLEQRARGDRSGG
ncbi:helix-turn-helix domain-containing protein [Blastococcus capsensis]|uniref:helix-turn-helix domain-containing protein n=1 Tax=Blastococcus capsensis TaxID=1564163 RepID=UPI002542506A|nr:helix-turn-helix transcriptional regulator [Blastococcus capsensis]MDK3258348.1 helix-turn-helix transcriptional regulator [Blastococcus capsensis]